MANMTEQEKYPSKRIARGSVRIPQSQIVINNIYHDNLPNKFWSILFDAMVSKIILSFKNRPYIATTVAIIVIFLISFAGYQVISFINDDIDHIEIQHQGKVEIEFITPARKHLWSSSSVSTINNSWHRNGELKCYKKICIRKPIKLVTPRTADTFMKFDGP